MAMQFIKIRPMTETDLEQVECLERDCFSTPWSKTAFFEALQNPVYRFYVAEENGIIVGQAGVIISFSEGELTNVAVSAAHRKRGIAHELLQYIFSDVRNDNVTEFTLEVRSGNKAAIALYEKLGFQSEGIRKNFYEKPTEDAVIMWKR